MEAKGFIKLSGDVAGFKRKLYLIEMLAKDKIIKKELKDAIILVEEMQKDINYMFEKMLEEY